VFGPYPIPLVTALLPARNSVRRNAPFQTARRLFNYIIHQIMTSPVKELELSLRERFGWGCGSEALSEKPKGRVAAVPHVGRSVHLRDHPTHVTLGVLPGLPLPAHT
jgi:hypothetical protein